jgi:hypothetical protein
MNLPTTQYKTVMIILMAEPNPSPEPMKLRGRYDKGAVNANSPLFSGVDVNLKSVGYEPVARHVVAKTDSTDSDEREVARFCNSPSFVAAE